MSRARIDGELSSRPLSGGDLGRARWIETTSGPVVEKTHPASLPAVPAGLVAAEAAGLAWLTVLGGPPVPAVRSHSAATLVLDAVVEGAPSAAGAEAFGAARAVARGGCNVVRLGAVGRGLHRHRIGRRGTFADWPSCWRARTARLLARLPGVDRAPFDALGARLDSLVPAAAPARVHGDLWAGNVLWDAGGTACSSTPPRTVATANSTSPCSPAPSTSCADTAEFASPRSAERGHERPWERPCENCRTPLLPSAP